MIWIDSQELENRLANGNLSDKEGFEYLLANLIMFTLIPYLPHSDFKNELFLWIEAITSILFIVILVRATFHINSNGDGKEYLKRFLPLFFVTATRLVVYAIIAAIPIGLIDLFVKKSIAS